MSAAFTRAVRYWVRATCKTPLRTAGSDGDMETVLRTCGGQAFIQGTSLAGALRSWAKQYAQWDTALLFGDQKREGRLVVSDGLFAPDANQYIRPRLAIQPELGTASDRSKFDVAHIGAGAALSFELVWMGDDQTACQVEWVEQLLAALHAGQIRLGAQKSNGFGRVELVVKKRCYRMENSEDLEAWLEDREDGTELPLPVLAPENRVVFTVTGRADSILIKGNAPEWESAEDDQHQVTTNLREGGKAILPASSIKGAVRARVSSIAALLGMEQTVVQQLFGSASRTEQGLDDGGVPGKVRFEDAQLDSSQRPTRISRIRINKFTGGVIRTGLFQEEPLCSRVTFRVSLPAEETAGCGLLLYALRDLGLGLYGLGSGGAVGRGLLSGVEITVQGPNASVSKLCFDQEGRCAMDDSKGQCARWLQAIGGTER